MPLGRGLRGCRGAGAFLGALGRRAPQDRPLLLLLLFRAAFCSLLLLSFLLLLPLCRVPPLGLCCWALLLEGGRDGGRQLRLLLLGTAGTGRRAIRRPRSAARRRLQVPLILQRRLQRFLQRWEDQRRAVAGPISETTEMRP